MPYRPAHWGCQVAVLARSPPAPTEAPRLRPAVWRRAAQVAVGGGASARRSVMRWIRRPLARPGVRTRTRRQADHAITEHGPDPGHVLLCAERGPRLYVHGNRPRVGAADRGSR